jgi:serine/threonine-protein kinase
VHVQAEVQGPPGRRLASWRRRAAAVVLDGVVLAGLVLFTLVAAGVPVEEIDRRIRTGEPLLVLLLFVAPRAIYDTALIGSRNQTLGKMALKIQVVDAQTAAPIGYLRAFRRWLSTATLWALFTVPGIVDHLWPLRDARKQTLHDKFAGSVVVHV